MKDFIKIIKNFFLIFLVVTVILPSIFSFLYSIFNKSYLEKKEKNLFNETYLIQQEVGEDAEKIGDYTIRRNISRIVNVDYSYRLKQNKMEEACKNALEKGEWRFLKKLKYTGKNSEELFFTKDGYKMSVNFYEENKFRIRITHDDVYSQMDL